MTREWADKYNRYPKHPGDVGRIRVWRQWYSVQGKAGVAPELQWNDKLGVVGCPRTEILAHSQRELLEERILPRYDPDNEAWEAYIAHHVNSKKIAIFVKGLEAERIVDHYEWHEIGPDHLFHAATYEMIARLAPRRVGMPAGSGVITSKRSTDQRPREAPPSTWNTRRGG
jgi:hypothetical protein